jgi:hypothetical protein
LLPNLSIKVSFSFWLIFEPKEAKRSLAFCCGVLPPLEDVVVLVVAVV